MIFILILRYISGIVVIFKGMMEIFTTMDPFVIMRMVRILLLKVLLLI